MTELTELRRNEFVDMLEMNDLLFIEKPHLIHSEIPKIGKITYYPKSDKLQISSTNSWETFGFNYIKTHLKKIAENLYTSEDMINASRYGYEYHRSTCFPAKTFEENCLNNTKQWLTTYKNK